ncbi:MAG: hypothetical protein SFW64_06985 [Alphaproteobacteria bacterium]|nr:hypothetical protein [Alphaproteobacteria bacterium]
MSEHGQSVGKDDVNKLLLDSLSKGVDALDRHNYREGEDTKKLFGLIEMDSSIANMVEVTYNTFIGSITKYLTPRTYETIIQHGKGHLAPTALNRVAAGVTFAVNAGIYAMPSITDAYKLWGKQQDELREKVRHLAPVLDEIKGKHGMSAYHGVTLEQNEMIAYDRWRRTKINHSELTGLILPALAKVAPNIWIHERNAIQALRRGEDIKTIEKEHFFSDVAKKHRETISEVAGVNADDVTHEHVARYEADGRVQSAIRNTRAAQERGNRKDEGFKLDGFAGVFGSNAALTTIANKMVESSARRLKRMFSTPYTALDMVVNLQEQLGNEPIPRSFQLPNRGRSLSLEAYVAEIMIQHQRDMATMRPDYAEIRDALKENVIAAAKPLAAALVKGDISALSLVNYVGGGKIIRNKGRLIASADEVEAIIEHHTAKAVQQHVTDPKKFWDDAPYDEKEGKQAFAALQGEEREIAIALIPHGVRQQFGISEKESKAVDERIAKELDTHIAEGIVGAVALGDAALRDFGLANSEIKQLKAAADKIGAEGLAAVHDLKSSAARAHGVDRVLLAVAVGSEIKGDKQHFGTILQKGRKQLAADDDRPRDDDREEGREEGDERDDEGYATHEARHHSNRHRHAAQERGGHAARESRHRNNRHSEESYRG